MPFLSSSGRSTLHCVVYTYYVALLLIIGVIVIFVSYAGFLALRGIEVVTIQLFYLIPEFWGILHDLMGFRATFFILQGGLRILDVTWSVVAFVQLSFAIGTALRLCGVVQAANSKMSVSKWAKGIAPALKNPTFPEPYC
ncbi:unnamed protein product [Bursaphelenchus okinawaensis]|uniref:Uncharacterized protein n=1 Tax=Bursaphelenchus okinawaensis TaxID=465554 RepID=A0A811L326_9BILA|nr:unnamed protein product [Bursaphelenchus okinawaensis]CAG9118063.1 unnamed protein product [Bursaphelenchus okinawaensis]